MRLFTKRLFMCVLASLSFVSCSEKESKPAQQLRVYLASEPFSLDPRIGGDRRSQMLMRELFEGLTRIGRDGKPHLAAAEAVDISPDGCTYRFTLKNSHWSSGDPVTAHDFAYAWKSVVDPNFPSGFGYAFTFIKGAADAKAGKIPLDEVGIHAVNDQTLVVELVHPAPYFLELAANPLYSPISQKADKKNPDWAKHGGSEYVCNGPFVLAEWKHQHEITLQKNPQYAHADRVSLEVITAPIIEDPQTALNMFERGDIDWVGEPFGNLPLEAIPALRQEGKLMNERIGGLFWYQVNTSKLPFTNKKIREAFAKAINRHELTDHLLQGGEMPAWSMLPQVLTGIEPPAFFTYNLPQAQALFQEGLEELGLDKKQIPVITLTHWQEPREKAIASAIQQQWQKAFGIEIRLSACDWNSYLAKFMSGDFDIAGLNWYCWYQDPVYNLESMKFKKGLNGTQWERPEFIALLDAADKEIDLDKRRKLLAQAEALLAEDLPLIPVYEHTYKFAKNPKVHGAYLSPVGQLELQEVTIGDK